MNEKVPCGVVGIFIDPKGNVIATATDFNNAGYGGFTLREAQTLRTKRALALDVAHKLCSPIFVEAISEYDCATAMSNMQKQGYKAVFLSIGEDEENGNYF